MSVQPRKQKKRKTIIVINPRLPPPAHVRKAGRGVWVKREEGEGKC